MASKIRGIEGMKNGELDFEIQRGGKFVLFQYCISIIVLTFRRPSDIYFLRQGESGVTKGLQKKSEFWPPADVPAKAEMNRPDDWWASGDLPEEFKPRQ